MAAPRTGVRHARPRKPRRLDQLIAVSLKDLVPSGNFYRHPNAKLDLGLVRGWVKDCYADQGRLSVDPVVLFKLQLMKFVEGLRLLHLWKLCRRQSGDGATERNRLQNRLAQRKELSLDGISAKLPINWSGPR